LSFFKSSPEVADLRILFSIKWSHRALNRGPKGYRFEIDWQKLLEIYPFLNHANLCKPVKSVNSTDKTGRYKSESGVWKSDWRARI